MNKVFVTAMIFTILGTLVLGYIAWLLYALAKSLERTLHEVTTTFLEADRSFKHLIDTLGAFEQMQQILELVKLSASRLSDSHDKIGSQLETTGRVAGDLHKLVTLWAAEGTQLQQAYLNLSEAIEKAIVVENDRALRLNADLQALLRDHAAGVRGS